MTVNLMIGFDLSLVLSPAAASCSRTNSHADNPE